MPLTGLPKRNPKALWRGGWFLTEAGRPLRHKASMTHRHLFRTFAENEYGYVGICAGCRTVNVAFQHSLFCLTLDQFDAFAEMMHDRLAMRPVSTSHGKELLLPTPMPNYFLLFSDDDLTSICALLAEAAPVLAVERILDMSQRLN